MNKRKYFFNQDYFNVIDSEDKAYFLGYLMADGWIQNNSIKLRIIDKEILIAFNFYLNGNLKIKTFKKTNNRKEHYEISINSKKMVNDLKKYNLIENKTKRTIIPDIDINLISHFIRGYFDGDGYIYIRKQGCSGAYGITSCSLNILKQIQYFCYKYNIIKIKQNYIKFSKNKLYATFIIDNIKEILNFGNFIYNNATIFLKRKHSKFIFFKERLNNKITNNQIRISIFYDKRTKFNPFSVKLWFRQNNKLKSLGCFPDRESAVKFRNNYIKLNNLNKKIYQ